VKSKHTGAVLVELAITALMFFIILFGVIEYSRLLFTWNTLTEITRRAARLAAVCPPNHPAIRDKAQLVSLPNFTDENIQVRYFDENDLELSSLAFGTVSDTKTDPSSTYNQNFGNIRYIQITVINYQHRLIIPVVGGLVSSPIFTTVIPRESLGIGPRSTDFNDCDFPL